MALSIKGVCLQIRKAKICAESPLQNGYMDVTLNCKVLRKVRVAYKAVVMITKVRLLKRATNFCVIIQVRTVLLSPP